MRFFKLIAILALLPSLSTAEDPVGKFLEHFETVYPATTGTRIEFTGNYLKLPEKLVKNLAVQFPELNIRTAKMKYLHWGMDPVNLMIFQEKESEEVVTYLWDIWFDSAPFSFENVAGFHIEFSPDSKNAFVSLAQLIAFSMSGSVDSVRESEGNYTTTLIDRHQRPWRVMAYSDGSIKFTKPPKIAAAQDGADQPATAPEPKPEGDQKPKPESEGAPLEVSR